MKKRKPKTQPEKRRPKNQADGQRTYRGNGKAIVTHSVAALPILNRFLERMRLRQFLERHLPPDDLRTKVDAPRVVLLLLKNLLVSREPIYGVAEWASNFAPELFDLRASQLAHLNDDRVGRCLDTVFRALDSNLIMDVVTHVVREFDTLRELSDLRDRLQSTRSRFRTHAKITQAVDAILDAHDARAFLRVEIELIELETFRQTHPGRPTEKTPYTRHVQLRFQLMWTLDLPQIERAAAGDGIFPLITNLLDWQAVDVLKAYKRQPLIEKRFSQLKTDFRVAPVFLKSVSRIVGLLAVYFLALVVQTLLERELRHRRKAQRTPSLPLYPEGRGCTRPTTRQVLDVFEPIARHTLRTIGKEQTEVFTTELAPIHRMILKLLRIPQAKYRA